MPFLMWSLAFGYAAGPGNSTGRIHDEAGEQRVLALWGRCLVLIRLRERWWRLVCIEQLPVILQTRNRRTGASDLEAGDGSSRFPELTTPLGEPAVAYVRPA